MFNAHAICGNSLIDMRSGGAACRTDILQQESRVQEGEVGCGIAEDRVQCGVKGSIGSGAEGCQVDGWLGNGCVTCNKEATGPQFQD